jgi:hypothetical protein
VTELEIQEINRVLAKRSSQSSDSDQDWKAMASDILKLDKIMGKKEDTTEDDEIDIRDLSLPKSMSDLRSSKKRERVSEKGI